MPQCVECGHSYFSASRRGRRSGLCTECRFKRNGGLRLERRIAPAPRPALPSEDWVTLHEAARLLAVKVKTLQTTRWLVRLGAMKVGKGWWVARTVLESLREQATDVPAQETTDEPHLCLCGHARNDHAEGNGQCGVPRCQCDRFIPQRPPRFGQEP